MPNIEVCENPNFIVKIAPFVRVLHKSLEITRMLTILAQSTHNNIPLQITVLKTLSNMRIAIKNRLEKANEGLLMPASP